MTMIEVYHQDERWHVRQVGQVELLSSHAAKDEAVGEGRRAARDRGAELVVKRIDGTIEEKDSHGNDPRNIPG